MRRRGEWLALTSSAVTLRQLLLRQLPLERVGPNLRRAARQAVAAGDPERMRRVAAAIVAELQRRGDLVRVAVEGGGPQASSLVLVRGRTTLIDLAVLNTPPSPSVPAPARPAGFGGGQTGPAAPAPPPRQSASLGEFQRLLQAMAHAQDLQVGGPLSAHRQVILEGILELLEGALPGLRLAVELHEETDPQVPSRRVVAAPAGAARPLWQQPHAPGAGLWIDSSAELPPALRLALHLEAPGAGQEAGAPFAGAVAVPLQTPPSGDGAPGAAGDEAGLLYLLPEEPWSPAVLLRLGRELALFVTRRWRRHQAMSLLVHTDSLTGVHNRAYFESQFAFELERARRRESPLALVLADIDHFKLINDRHGHPIGDLVLKAVARALQGALRRIDVVCRVGGEEFALLLPDTPPAAAHEVGQRLLEQMNRRVNLMGPPGLAAPAPLHVTLSFGGVTYPDGGADAAELYRKADGMLYLSKRQGRNRCTFWNPHGDALVLIGPPASAS